MSNIPAGYKLVLDLSYHQKVDYDLVCKYIDGVILRLGFGKDPDPAFRNHYEQFRLRGKAVAGYQWFRPDQDVKAQIDTVRSQIENTDVRVVFSDQEQHGVYFNGGSIPPYYSQGVLSDRCRAHVTGMETLGLKVGTYSRSTWVWERCRPSIIKMAEWPNHQPWRYDYLVWLASWPYASGGVTTTWESLLNFYARRVFSPYFVSGWPAELKRADAWQFTGDKFILPGIYNVNGIPRAVDINYVSETALDQFNQSEPEPVPQPEPQPAAGLQFRVLRALNVRSGPGTVFADIGDLSAGQVVTARSVDGANVWIEIDIGKWAAIIYNGVRYMEQI